MFLLSNILIIQVIEDFSSKFDKLREFLRINPPQESVEDKHEFLIEITSNPNSSLKTPQTWLDSFQKECFLFGEKYFIMWKNKGFISSDLCKTFKYEGTNKLFFTQFLQKLKEQEFVGILKEEYFQDWKKAQVHFLKKLRCQGLRRSIKGFVHLERGLDYFIGRSFFCKIKRFEEEAHQNLNSAIERGREEGIFNQDQILKNSIMKLGFVENYVEFLEKKSKATKDQRYLLNHFFYKKSLCLY